jgi:hypothetical protein
LARVEQLAEHFNARDNLLLGGLEADDFDFFADLTTVPRPEIENTSSIGIRNGLSTSRSGTGM